MVSKTLVPEIHANQYQSIALLSLIYRCVCKDFRERLYTDLNSFVLNHINRINQELIFKFENSHNSLSNLFDYLLKFYETIVQYDSACKAIVAIFHYLNINYVMQKLKSDLNAELLTAFLSELVDKHVIKILELVNDLDRNQLTQMQIEILELLIDGLYKLRNEYANLNFQVFNRYSISYNKTLQQHQQQHNENDNEQLKQCSDSLILTLQTKRLQNQEFEQSNDRKRHMVDGISDIEPETKHFC